METPKIGTLVVVDHHGPYHKETSYGPIQPLDSAFIYLDRLEYVKNPICVSGAIYDVGDIVDTLTDEEYEYLCKIEVYRKVVFRFNEIKENLQNCRQGISSGY